MSDSSDRTELAQFEQEWMSAMQSRDMARLEELVAPGFRFTAIHLLLSAVQFGHETARSRRSRW